MDWVFTEDRPIWQQLMEQITLMILNGGYPPGSRLPAVRDLASEAGVNPNTMQRAFAELERNGLVMAQRTSGRVVTENMEMISEVRNKLAREQIREFIDKMKKLGFEKKEILSLLEEDGEPKTAE